jgi:predicted transcriptional regulator
MSESREASMKDRVLHAVRQLPDDAGVEEAMERLYFLAKVERGIQEAEQGKAIDHEKVRERFLK